MNLLTLLARRGESSNALDGDPLEPSTPRAPVDINVSGSVFSSGPLVFLTHDEFMTLL